MRLISDAALGAITIFQEARNQPYEGKCAVGEVIRERMRQRFFSDGTVAGTVCRAYQFSGWNSADPNRVPSLCADDKDPVVQECVRAWHNSAQTNLVNGAIFYLNPQAVLKSEGRLPKWWSSDADPASEVVIGDHAFRKKR